MERGFSEELRGELERNGPRRERVLDGLNLRTWVKLKQPRSPLDRTETPVVR